MLQAAAYCSPIQIILDTAVFTYVVYIVRARRVPETFLSTSHEYNRIHDYGDERNVASWAEVFKMLSPSPIIRVGGASQDKMTQVSLLTWDSV